MIRQFLSCLLFGATLAATPLLGDWPQLRGSHAGHSDAVGPPLTWSEEENVAWKVPVPGRGYSSPVVLGDQIWLTTADDETRALRALAFNRASGELLHDIEVFRPDAFQDTHHENSYASPTPVIEPGRVYVHFGAYGTAALATDDGRILWRSREIVVDHEVGPGSSPILWQDLLIVHFDGTDRRLVAAFDKATGEIVWRSPRTVALDKKGTHKKAFSTPIVVEHRGELQLVSPAADQVSGLDPRTGEEIWRVRYEGYSIVPQPVAGLGRVFVDTGYIKPHLFAIRLGGRGDVTDTHVEWRYHWQVPANPTPLLIGDRLFMISDWGRASWLDARRGEDIWLERLGGRYWASPLVAAGRIYTFAADGTTTVLAVADEYRVLATNHLDAEIRTTPAIAGRAFFVRGTTHLYRLENLVAEDGVAEDGVAEDSAPGSSDAGGSDDR